MDRWEPASDMRSSGILRKHWDGLHLRCNVCGGDVITLKDYLELDQINNAWDLHRLVRCAGLREDQPAG